VEDIIRRLIDFALGPFRVVIEAFRNSVLRMWQVLVSFFTIGRDAWRNLRAWVDHFMLNRFWSLLAIYDWGRNLIFVRIPRLLDQLSRDLTSWAARLINDVGNLARALYRQAIDFATRAVNVVRGILDDLSRWVTAWINRLIADVTRLLRRIFDDWASPERLAAWLVGAMFRALWGFFLSNVERVSVALWPLRMRIIMNTLGLVERILARVL
jgi:AcrR family transcriptional regulator